MKTIGLIGGMSWESSLEYYRLINQITRDRLGGQNNAQTLMVTVNFHDIERMQREGRWDDAGAALAQAAEQLERGGADFIVLCTNTMHKVTPAIETAVSIPLLHIARATAQRVVDAGVRRVGLLATAYTMEQDFYKGILRDHFGLGVLIPDAEDRAVVHAVIYDELCLGLIKESSRRAYAQIMARLEARGAEGIILGCTEIALLVKPEDSHVPQFDTTRIHCETAVERALA
ncbi:MAG: aspartate/glutamate racemase family protein [Anaerolineae bacterium]|nr:aspartate/glutamate racemase family protein [Anaerolineae bacterium]NUQ03921.1 aspartate/glutamate racemase family protein [Anaerolineae bacterium]